MRPYMPGHAPVSIRRIMRLSEVAHILPGIPFRSRIESHSEGVLAVVQARDLGVDGTVKLGSAIRIGEFPETFRAHLKAGDILLQPRGMRFPAARFEPSAIPAIAAAPLTILRADTSRLVPEFLLALLMSPMTQAIFRQAAVGTHVPQVPRQAIADLRIDLPDIPGQIRLADLARLGQREAELMDRLRDARARFFDLAVKEVAKKSRKRANAPGFNHDPNGAPTPMRPLSI
jgi:hypothetical protein